MELEQLGLELGPVWGVDIADNDLTYWATMLVLNVVLL